MLVKNEEVTMDYKIYTNKIYSGTKPYRLSFVINGGYYTELEALACKLYNLDLINDVIEFIVKYKSLKFSEEETMSSARDEIEAILIMGKMTF
jgi:hypothetical protein